jgi:tail tube protein
MAANSANRRQISAVLETTLGTTPTTPRMRQKVVTAEALKYAPTLVDSAEMRSDRMTSDSVITGLDSSGPMTWEFHFPYPDSAEDFDIRSAFYNNWVLTPVRDNDTVAGSVITAAAVGALTVTTGATFALGHLVRTTGFAVAANNTIAKVTTASATAVTATGAYAVEASPPGTARAKVVGFQGASADITATASGLASTSLDFTTLGLAVGQWIKIGGTAATERFVAAGINNNTRVRITAIAAHALTLDNLPAGWAAEAGATRLIKVWFGDRIVNGTTQISQSFERGDLGMNVPVYMVSPGMVVASLAVSIKPKVIITAVATYMGMAAATPNSTTTLDAVIDPAPAQALFPQFAGSANVGSMRENGVQLTSPNWCIGLDFTIANNIQPAETIDGVGPQDLVPGECLVTGTCNTIFGDATLLNRFLNGTPTNLNLALQKNNQMVFISFPRVVFNSDGAVNANAKNQIINASFGFRASKDDSLTGVIVSMDRLEYFEA